MRAVRLKPLVSLLAEQPAMTTGAWLGASRLARATFHRYLRELVDLGVIVRAGRGRWRPTGRSLAAALAEAPTPRPPRGGAVRAALAAITLEVVRREADGIALGAIIERLGAWERAEIVVAVDDLARRGLVTVTPAPTSSLENRNDAWVAPAVTERHDAA